MATPLAEGWLIKRSPKTSRFARKYVERYFQLFTAGNNGAGFMVYRRNERDRNEKGRIVLNSKSTVSMLGLIEGRWKFLLRAEKAGRPMREWHLYAKTESDYKVAILKQ